MPIYEYQCVKCGESAELLLPSPPKPLEYAGACTADEGNPCEMFRVWAANFGVGFVDGAGFAPARTTLGDKK